ncbi:MAG: hypothetical protein V4793_11825 [Paraburkholderia tropica]
MIEHVILGAFLVIPLVIVVLLLTAQIHHDHPQRRVLAGDHHIDWRHPLRSLLHH